MPGQRCQKYSIDQLKSVIYLLHAIQLAHLQVFASTLSYDHKATNLGLSLSFLVPSKSGLLHSGTVSCSSISVSDSSLSCDALWVDPVHSDNCYRLLIPPLFQSDLVCLLNGYSFSLFPLFPALRLLVELP